MLLQQLQVGLLLCLHIQTCQPCQQILLPAARWPLLCAGVLATMNVPDKHATGFAGGF